MKRVVDLNADTSTAEWRRERRMKPLMAGPPKGRRCRANNETLNQDLISRSPGDSRIRGLDFVKAVYSDRTGQEPMY